MIEQRPGIKTFADPGWGVQVTQPAAAPPVVWSLYFDRVGDEVQCGSDPSVMDLHTGDFTVDCYFMTPDLTGLPNATGMGVVGQCSYFTDGWGMQVIKFGAAGGGTAAVYLGMEDGGGTWRTVLVAIPLAGGVWQYVRARRDAAGAIHISVNAGAESNLAVVGATVSAQQLRIAHNHFVGIYWGYSNTVYVHAWNNDQGALGAVPGTPFALGANTAARYRFTDGAGAVLTDDSGNGNNGNIVNAAWQQVGPAGWTP